MSDPDISVEQWGPIVASLIGTDPAFAAIPYAYAQKWNQIESDGNACAIGTPGASGPDGEPKEIGLGQLYNPDDFKRLGLPAAKFRAYCQPYAPLAKAYFATQDPAERRQIARAMQTKTRPLTEQEMLDQVRYTLLTPITWGVATADKAVAAYSLAHWQPVDYWKLVKANHAYPPILNKGLPAVCKQLGRAPRDWLEFRQVLGVDVKGSDGKPKYPLWVRGLNACEACGNAIAAQGVA